MIVFLGLVILGIGLGFGIASFFLLRWVFKKTCSIAIKLLKLLVVLPVIAITLAALIFGLYVIIGGITFILAF